MYLVDTLLGNETEVNNKWCIARPINYQCRTIGERFADAWFVFTGKADAVFFAADLHSGKIIR